jgi:hypothetical protein
MKMSKTKDDLMIDVVTLYDKMIEFGFLRTEYWSEKQLRAFIPFTGINGDSIYFDAVIYYLQNKRKEEDFRTVLRIASEEKWGLDRKFL